MKPLAVWKFQIVPNYRNCGIRWLIQRSLIIELFISESRYIGCLHWTLLWYKCSKIFAKWILYSIWRYSSTFLFDARESGTLLSRTSHSKRQHEAGSTLRTHNSGVTCGPHCYLAVYPMHMNCWTSVYMRKPQNNYFFNVMEYIPLCLWNIQEQIVCNLSNTSTYLHLDTTTCCSHLWTSSDHR